MQEEALQRFLASVRCERFIDYLDPIGETAEEALARRVRWARMTRNDPAHADEAMFLLQHELDLRAVLDREVASEESWVEGVPAGTEDGASSGWSNNRAEKTTLDELHKPATEIDESPTGIMRIEDLSLDRFDALATVDSSDTLLPPDDFSDEFDPPSDAGAIGEDRDETEVATPRATPAPAPDLPRASSADGPDSVPTAPPFQAPLTAAPAGLLKPRGAVRTANPAERRSMSPTLPAFGTVEPTSNPTLMPPDVEEPLSTSYSAPDLDDEQTDPSFRRDPELIKAIRAAAAGEAFDPVVVGTGGDPDAATVKPPSERTDHPTSDDESKRAAPPPPAPMLGPRASEGGVPWLPIAAVAIAVLLVGGGVWFAVDASSEANTPTPASPRSVEPVATPAAPKPAPAEPANDTPEPAPKPVEPAPQPTPEPVEPPTPEPAEQPTAEQPTPEPTAAATTPEPEPAPAPAPQPPAPVPEPPAPEAPAPEPAVAPVPAPQPSPEPAPEPTPAPAPAPAPVAAPEPAPAPEPAAAPEPSPVPAPAAPTPAPESTPEPAAAGGAATPVKGLWGGKIGGRGFVLALTGQDGNTVNGSAEVLEASGSWSKFTVSGTITGGQLTLTGPGVQFDGTVTGRSMRGNMTRDGTKTPFTAAR